MRIVGRLALESFADSHPQMRAQIRAWLTEAATAKWTSAHDVKNRYRRASVISAGRIVFDIGKSFRIDTRIDYEMSIMQVVRFAFHKEYERWTF